MIYRLPARITRWIGGAQERPIEEGYLAELKGSIQGLFLSNLRALADKLVLVLRVAGSMAGQGAGMSGGLAAKKGDDENAKSGVGDHHDRSYVPAWSSVR